MKLFRWAGTSAVLALYLLACQSPQKPSPAEDLVSDSAFAAPHPDWIMQGNIYEVNIRQYSPEGSFAAFEKSLPRLKEMGVQTLWLMPINPISVADRKGQLGSYYAVSNYYAINPEFGTLSDFKSLVTHAHELGFKVIIDWVPNHTGADHYWLKTHPEFYVLDSVTHKPLAPFDWSDVRQLNYHNQDMRDSMINSMKYWLTETKIDGFRCDVAWGVPDDFWKHCIGVLRTVHPGLLMLAEADGPNYHRDGFDITYPWATFHKMVSIAKGELPATALDSMRLEIDSTYPADALKLYFTSNHDENSWNKADYGTMPGPIHAPFAVYTLTMARSVPLIYSGQEEPVLDSISFFYKDSIHFEKLARAKFYKTLLDLRQKNPALAADAAFRKVSVGNDKAVYAYVRSSGEHKVLVILNLSAKTQNVRITDSDLHGKPYNVFMYMNEPVGDQTWKIEPWGYVVYVYN